MRKVKPVLSTEIDKENQTKSKKDIEKIIFHQISIEDSHPRQEKPKCFGEVIEMDGSIHQWFGKKKTCLHLAINLCSGNIVGGVFRSQETLKGYYVIYKQILTKYGISVLFKTDNRTVFNYGSLNRTSDKNVRTQFSYAYKILGTDLKTTSVSQAKGTIEKANGNSIKFKNKYYQPFDSRNNLICFKAHTECLVIEAFDGLLLVTVDEKVYQLKELREHKKVSIELDEIIKDTPKKIYIPPMSHPWKASSFKKQLEKAHTNHVYA